MGVAVGAAEGTGGGKVPQSVNASTHNNVKQISILRIRSSPFRGLNSLYHNAHRKTMFHTTYRVLICTGGAKSLLAFPLRETLRYCS
jgi:hypothetical protein